MPRMSEKKTERKKKGSTEGALPSVDFNRRLVVFSVASLVLLGFLMVYTSSGPYAMKDYGFSYYFLLKQATFGLVGILALIFAYQFSRHLNDRLVKIAFWFTCLLCLLVLIPGIGIKVGGARRWLGIAGLRFQPSELVKLTMAIFTAYLSKNGMFLVRSLRNAST